MRADRARDGACDDPTRVPRRTPPRSWRPPPVGIYDGNLSVIEIGDRVHEVVAEFGNNEFGGKDLDRAIAESLVRRIEKQYGLAVPESGLARRRLLVAAEDLKIQLSSKSEARYALPRFLDRDVDVTLTATELAATLAPVREA